MLFSETEAVYAGKTIDVMSKVIAVAKELSGKGLRHLILLPGTRSGLEIGTPQISSIPNA